MKNQVTRLLEMFRAVVEGEPWHGQSMTQVLQNISVNQATAYPIKRSHSIWEFLLHIINWREFAIRNILDTEPYVVELNTEKDWTTVKDFSEEAWENTLQLFQKSNEEFCQAVKTLSDEQLDNIVPAQKYTFYTLLHGVIQHDIYHSGQIILLKKMLVEEM